MAGQETDCFEYEFLDADALLGPSVKRARRESSDDDLKDSDDEMPQTDHGADPSSTGRTDPNELKAILINLLTPMHLKLNRIQSTMDRMEDRLQNMENLLRAADDRPTMPRGPVRVKSGLPWPVPDREALDKLEERLKAGDEEITDKLVGIFEQMFSCEIGDSMRRILRGLLAKSGRWTFTGRTANNVIHTPGAPTSDSASALECVGLLKESAMRKYRMHEKEIDRVIISCLQKINDATRKAELKRLKQL